MIKTREVASAEATTPPLRRSTSPEPPSVNEVANYPAPPPRAEAQPEPSAASDVAAASPRERAMSAIDRHPWAAVGVAAGVGLALGAGSRRVTGAMPPIPPRAQAAGATVGSILFGTAARFAVSALIGQLARTRES